MKPLKQSNFSFANPEISDLRADRIRPTKGWMDGTQKSSNGAPFALWKEEENTAASERTLSEDLEDRGEYEIGVIFQFWKNAEKEEEFKRDEIFITTNGQEELAVEAFARDLKAAGADRWEERHVDFRLLDWR